MYWGGMVVSSRCQTCLKRNPKWSGMHTNPSIVRKNPTNLNWLDTVSFLYHQQKSVYSVDSHALINLRRHSSAAWLEGVVTKIRPKLSWKKNENLVGPNPFEKYAPQNGSFPRYLWWKKNMFETTTYKTHGPKHPQTKHQGHHFRAKICYCPWPLLRGWTSSSWHDASHTDWLWKSVPKPCWSGLWEKESGSGFSRHTGKLLPTSPFILQSFSIYPIMPCFFVESWLQIWKLRSGEGWLIPKPKPSMPHPIGIHGYLPTFIQLFFNDEYR